jgi:diguanylate cyclase (GGDEF)-like protein/PAS domain S-box-containing protein
LSGLRSNAERSAESMARRYRTLLERLPQTAVVVFDKELRLELVTGRPPGDEGLEPEPIDGLRLEDIVPPDTAAVLARHYRRALAGEEVSLEYGSLLDGRSYWLNIVPLLDDLGEVEGGMAVTLDVTVRAHGQDALRRSEERFRRAFDDAPIGMALLALDGRVRKVNSALCQITGHDQAELVGEYLAALTVPGDAAQRVDDLERLIAGEHDTHRGELRLRHGTGASIATAMHAAIVRDGHGEPEHVLLQIQDISDRKHFEDELQLMADHDPLTGLLNPRGLRRELDSHIARGKRYGPHGALLALDLDQFRSINDTLGHRAGDELIIRLAGLLRERLRDSDVIARLGADEFAVLLPHVTRQQAETVAAALGALLHDEEVDHGTERPRRITTSVGVAMFDDDDLTSQEALIRANVAMYESKAAGPGRVSFYAGNPGGVPRVRATMTWVDRIRAALREERLCLLAQPIVALNPETPAMYEMLLRMVDENGELILPGEFLSVAERFDLIGGIDRWVIGQAIGVLEQATTDGHAATVSVNISAKSLGDADLLARIEGLLSDHAIAPEMLVFEVTETAVIANLQPARHFAERLRELGCRLALDDFGSGLHSFYHLKHLPFDFLKIDGEFITNCLVSPTDRLLVQALVTIAQGLDKLTVAEFTPDQQTLDFLGSLGVDFSQGFFTGPPVPLEETLLVAASPAS